MLDVTAIKADFPGTSQQVYLNTAGVGLPPRSALDAVQEVCGLLGQGPAQLGYGAYYQALARRPPARKTRLPNCSASAPRKLRLLTIRPWG